MPTLIQMNAEKKEQGNQVTISMGPWPDFHFIWISDVVLIFMAEIQYAISTFDEYLLSTCLGSFNLLRCPENSIRIGKVLALFNSHSNWRSPVRKEKPSDILSVIGELSNTPCPTNQLSIHESAVISLRSLSTGCKAQFHKASHVQMHTVAHHFQDYIMPNGLLNKQTWIWNLGPYY